MDKVAGKLQDEGQLPLLLDGPGWRNPEQRLIERLVVGEQGKKIPTFQEEGEVSHGGVGSQKLPVEGGVTELGSGQLLGEEGKQSPGSSNQLQRASLMHPQLEKSWRRDLDTSEQEQRLRKTWWR